MVYEIVFPKKEEVRLPKNAVSGLDVRDEIQPPTEHIRAAVKAFTHSLAAAESRLFTDWTDEGNNYFTPLAPDLDPDCKSSQYFPYSSLLTLTSSLKQTAGDPPKMRSR